MGYLMNGNEGHVGGTGEAGVIDGTVIAAMSGMASS